MTYPEDVLRAAREAAIAEAAEDIGATAPDLLAVLVEGYRSGRHDSGPVIKAACIAIMAERQRCAEIAEDEAAFHARRILGMGSGRMRGVLRERDMVCRRIRRTILGQQEPSA